MKAWIRDRQGIAIGRSVVNRTGLKLGDRFSLVGDIYPLSLDLVVRAIFDGPEDNNSFFHYEYFDKSKEALLPGYQGNVGTFYLRVRSSEDIPRVVSAIDEMFRNAPQPTKTETERAFQLAFVSQLGNVKSVSDEASRGRSSSRFCWFPEIPWRCRFVSASREIGVVEDARFHVGFPSLDDYPGSRRHRPRGRRARDGVSPMGVTVFAAEMLITFFEGLIMPWWGPGFCLGVALLIGIISSIVPAVIAARTRVTDALRHTG